MAVDLGSAFEVNAEADDEPEADEDGEPLDVVLPVPDPAGIAAELTRGAPVSFNDPVAEQFRAAAFDLSRSTAGGRERAPPEPEEPPTGSAFD